MKKILGPILGFFCHFLKFGSLVFLENAYNAGLQECLTCSRGKIHKKELWAQIWVKFGPEIMFFPSF